MFKKIIESLGIVINIGNVAKGIKTIVKEAKSVAYEYKWSAIGIITIVVIAILFKNNHSPGQK